MLKGKVDLQKIHFFDIEFIDGTKLPFNYEFLKEAVIDDDNIFLIYGSDGNEMHVIIERRNVKYTTIYPKVVKHGQESV